MADKNKVDKKVEEKSEVKSVKKVLTLKRKKLKRIL